MPPPDDTPPPSASSPAPPDIETLLKNSRWEDRVAEARVKREGVLAAKRAEQEKPPKMTPPTRRVRPQPDSPAHRNPPEPRPRGRFVVLVLASAALSAGLGALVAWLSLT